MMCGMAADHIGTRIKRARERLRWTQRNLADAVGVNVKSVDNWENGRTSPRSAIGALEDVLGVSLSDGIEAQRPSLSAEEAIDRAQRELDELRRVLREEGRGKARDDEEPNGGRRAS